MAVRQQFGHLGKDAARGLALRHDHGSAFMAEDFQNQIKAWGMLPSYAFVGQPETNGVIERFFRTFKEQVVHGRIFQTIDDFREAVRDFVLRYNTQWLVERTATLAQPMHVKDGSTRTCRARHSATYCPGDRVRYTAGSPANCLIWISIFPHAGAAGPPMSLLGTGREVVWQGSWQSRTSARPFRSRRRPRAIPSIAPLGSGSRHFRVHPPSPRPAIHGGYLERLPLAAVRAGLCDSAEVWTFAGTDAGAGTGPEATLPLRRRFRADGPAPYPSTDVLAHLDVFGPPAILCTWGLGVDAAILARCGQSVRVYNSIDAPALRIPRRGQPPHRPLPRERPLAGGGDPRAPPRRPRRGDAYRPGVRFARNLLPDRRRQGLRRDLRGGGAALQAPRHPARRLRPAPARRPRPLRLRLRRGRRGDPGRDRRARAQHRLHRTAGREPFAR